MTARLQPMALENFLHRGDHAILGHRDLRRPRRLPLLVRGDGVRRTRAFDQILDLNLATRALVGALNDNAGTLRRSAYFICAFMPAAPR